MKQFTYNNLTRSFASMSPGDIQVVSLRNCLRVPEAKALISSCPKLSRLVTALLSASNGKLPFIYLVNYKFPDNVLRGIKSAGPDNNVILSDVFKSNQSDKMHQALQSTQGLFISSYHDDDFNSSVLSKYGIPDLNGHNVYIDINKLTTKKSKDILQDYQTEISYHISHKAVSASDKDIEIHKSNIKVNLPRVINLN